MALILTYLGKGGTGSTTLAIAAAKRLASQGQRVLLASESQGPVLALLLGQPISGSAPVLVEPNLSALELRSTALLQQAWEQLKLREAEYLRDPFFKNVYGEELSVLPGMDAALGLNAVREYAQSGNYDAIVYDGRSAPETLRNLGSLEVMSWYVRRFRQVIVDSGVYQSLQPFMQPVAMAVLNSGVASRAVGGSTVGPMDEALSLLETGRAALADVHQTRLYLVTTADPLAIAQARHLWGCAQQVGLHVSGVLVNPAAAPMAQVAGETDWNATFAPLPVTQLPQRVGDDWQLLSQALPDPAAVPTTLAPLTLDLAAQQLRVFLPGFDKAQVKLTQSNQEITIEAGDQRRNIILPAPLQGRTVSGAKFQDQHLVISF